MEIWPWATLVLLGVFHGVNPAMGWLFAVGLGLQEQNRRAVLRSLVPIALGHAVSIGAVVAVVGVARVLVDPHTFQLAAAGVILVFGGYRLARGSRHGRARVGMRVNFFDLTFWSFLMATAHGAGLMVVPALLGLPVANDPATLSNPHLGMVIAVGSSFGVALAAVAVHTFAMLIVAGAIAVVIFDRVGLAILRRAWVNLDLLWALVLLCAGGILLVL